MAEGKEFSANRSATGPKKIRSAVGVRNPRLNTLRTKPQSGSGSGQLVKGPLHASSGNKGSISGR